MSDFTRRGIAKRKAAQKQMLTEAANTILANRENEAQAQANSLKEAGVNSFNFAAAGRRQKRQGTVALKEYNEVVHACVQRILAETVFNGIPADKEEKAPYHSSIIEELTVFFKEACEYSKDNALVVALSEEVGLLVSEGFDVTGGDNSNFKEYALKLVEGALANAESPIIALTEQYSTVTSERTLQAIIASQEQAEQLSAVLSAKVGSLSESVAQDKHLAEVALKKVYSKVTPTLFESVFTFIKRKLTEQEEFKDVTNEQIMQEATCYLSMLEGAHAMGVLPKMRMSEFVKKLTAA